MKKVLMVVNETKRARSVLSITLVLVTIKFRCKKTNERCWKERETYAA